MTNDVSPNQQKRYSWRTLIMMASFFGFGLLSGSWGLMLLFNPMAIFVLSAVFIITVPVLGYLLSLDGRLWLWPFFSGFSLAATGTITFVIVQAIL